MSQRDWQSPHPAHVGRGAAQGDFPALADEMKHLISSLAAEIEDARRRQTSALEDIEARLAAAERSRAQLAADPESGWDRQSAEALTQAYEHMSRHVQGSSAGEREGWLPSRFGDLTQQVRSALANAIQPQVPFAQLEDRFSRLQDSISQALVDVARRSDVEGLRSIAGQVDDLAGRLDAVQHRLASLDQLEHGLAGTLTNVADERVARLIDHGNRLAHDLEAMAKRAAAEMSASLENANATASQEADRYENLRTLVEAAIQEWREADANAASVVQGLGNIVSAQAERYDELRALIEAASRERRQDEAQAVAMLDTLQEALVRILDRLDGIEASQSGTSESLQELRQSIVRQPQPPPIPVRDEPRSEPLAFAFEQRPSHPQPPPIPVVPIETRSETPPNAAEQRPRQSAPAKPVAIEDSMEPAFEPADIPAPRAKPGPAAASGLETAQNPVDRLRRDLVAEAQRAKLKAAVEAQSESAKSASGQKPAESASPFSGQLPRMLAIVLAGVVLINGALLLFGRKPAGPPAIAIESPIESSTPATEPGAADAPAPSPPPESEQSSGDKPRSDLEQAPSNRLASQDFGYGFHNDILESPYGAADTSFVTGGLAAEPSGISREAKLAATYQQQVMAGLSARVGIAAATSSPDALLPDVNGRVVSPPVEVARLTTRGAETNDAAPAPHQNRSQSKLELPPATVGPLSLRLAAANGDPSAEFEVASRLAEGRGTDPSYKEAVVWYHRAAAQGFTQAHYRLGTLFERGLGVEKDLGRARVWYQRAAEQGNVKAMHNFAVLSAGGMGEPDYATAIGWFSKAAEHGLSDSQFNLGVLLENGLGIAQDRISAYKWYALAAEGGDKDAAGRRDALRTSFSAEESERADALLNAFRVKPSDPIANDPLIAGEEWKKRAGKEAEAQASGATTGVLQ